MSIYKSVFRSISLFIILLGIITNTSHGQTYLTSAGLRLGDSWGLTVNQRVLKKVTVEGIIQNDFKQTTYLHVLGRVHENIISRRLNIYYGGGIHTGLQTGTGGIAGFDAVVGLELTMLRFNISADYKPHITSGEGNGFSSNAAVSVRYVLVKNNAVKKWNRKRKKKKRKRQRQKQRKYNGRS